MRHSLGDLKLRTYKSRDSWWTVILVDPVAVRLVWLVSPYRWITPNLVTFASFVLGIAAAVAFGQGDRLGLALGAFLFYLAFVLDCVDGKVARLHQNGSLVGKWLEFLLDRVRFLLGAGALFYGQYQFHQDQRFLWFGVAVVVLDLLHYLNGAEMRQTGIGNADGSLVSSGVLGQHARKTPVFRLFAGFLENRRIRPRLFSGVEFEQFICVLAPLTASVLLVTGLSVIVHVLFEAATVFTFLQASMRATTPGSKEEPPIAEPGARSIGVPRQRSAADTTKSRQITTIGDS